MNNVGKIIKYVAIAIAICLIASIVTGILTAVGTIFGISALIDVAQGSVETMSYVEQYVDISSLQIDVSAIDLQIVAISDTNEIKVVGKEIPTDYKFELQDNRLKIKGKKVSTDANLIIFLPDMVSDLDIDVGAGTVQIKDVSVQKLDLNMGATETYIENLTVMSKAKIDGGTGEVVIEDSNIANLDFDSGFGKLEYTGYLTGVSDIDCGIGNVEFNLKGTETLYKIIAEKGIGELKVNGNKLRETQAIGNGINIVKISGGIGSIEVNY